MAAVAGARYHVEHLLEEAKGTAGLGHYQVRYWHSGYRHMTLALLAHAWLAIVRHRDAQNSLRPLPFWLRLSLAELACLLNICHPTPTLSRAFRLHWWRWRRAKRMVAVRSRYRHEPALLAWLTPFMQLRL